ncbi:hypothetical protein RF11_09754 [Thelohanellus kitauei]|uniref:Uncharacterized protein n=1 Tax=Thelohanellus kitauei TaxID=669202 RepID=A0A0C2JCL0_THEKT|nr:hypothetical protein RF11_09754 [Thelohanellus kitauei]
MGKNTSEETRKTSIDNCLVGTSKCDMQPILGMSITTIDGIINTDRMLIGGRKSRNNFEIYFIKGEETWRLSLGKSICIYELIEEVDQETIYFLDEMGFDVSMTHKRCRSKKGDVPLSTLLHQVKEQFHVGNNEQKVFDILQGKDPPFNEFLSHGKHECIFIMDDGSFHKTNSVQTMLQENGPMRPRDQDGSFHKTNSVQTMLQENGPMALIESG